MTGLTDDRYPIGRFERPTKPLDSSTRTAYIGDLEGLQDAPIIKLYDQSAWGSLPDAATAPIEASLQLLGGLHQRWGAFLRLLDPADFERTFVHPKSGPMSLDGALAMYRWHGRHHAAHIRIALGGAGASGQPRQTAV